jgi:hypothetical protein
MIRRTVVFLVAMVAALPALADSLSLAMLADDDHGRSIDLHGQYSPIEALTLAASAGHSSAALSGGEDFKGNSLGASIDLDVGAFFANGAIDHWKDSGELRSTALHGELGYLADNGLSLAALVASHDLRATYSATVLGQLRERDIDFQGTGFGGDLSWYGEAWTTGVRYLAYDYGRSVDRVRSVLESANTQRFPRLQRLAGSVATRAAGAPDREASFMLARQFDHKSLTASLQWQRDAVTRVESKGVDLTLGLDPAKHWAVDVSIGASRDKEAGTIAWAGLALKLRSAQQDP